MTGKTILVVDNDPVFCKSLTELLNRANYNAYCASNGRSAISIAESLGCDVDLMVIEMALPDMSGISVIGTIAERQKTIIKVIASSSIFSQAELESQRSFHANAGIRKEQSGIPAVAATWLQTVRGLLGELSEPATKLRHDLILLVDDDACVRHLVKTILSRDGYQVLEAADGIDALVLAGKLGGAIDLLVTDVEMPGMDGRVLVKNIRETYSRIPVIYISGFQDESEMSQLHDPERGIAFVEKPFQPKVLLEIVASMLNAVRPTG